MILWFICALPNNLKFLCFGFRCLMQKRQISAINLHRVSSYEHHTLYKRGHNEELMWQILARNDFAIYNHIYWDWCTLALWCTFEKTTCHIRAWRVCMLGLFQRKYKQRVLMHRHQGLNVRHGLCHIYMRYLYIYELFIAFVCFVVCSLL